MPREKLNIFLLSLCQALMLASTMTLLTYSALVGKMLSPDPVWAALPVATAVLGSALSAVPASYFMRKFGRKRGFQIGALNALTSGALALYALIRQDFILFCLATWFHGNYQAFAAFYRFTAMEVSSPNRQKQAVSFVLAGGIAAALLTPTITGYFTSVLEPLTFAGPYALVLCLSLLAQIPIALLRVPHKVQPMVHDGNGRRNMPVPSSQKTPWGVLRRPTFICACLNAGGGYLLMSFVMTASPLAVMFCGYQTTDAAMVIQVHVLAMFAPAFVTGSLIARFGAVPIIFLGMASYAIAAAVAIYDIELSNFYLSLALVGIGWNFMFTAGTTLLAEAHTEAEKTFAQGVNDFLVYSMMAAASLSSGYIFETLGWTRLNLIVYAVLLFLFLVTLWYVVSHSKPRTSSAEKKGEAA
tara:strand:- start:5139 stop:6380 length:1242 start_codon:yes stop_codon:yes gene_type:complete